jgi:hypothetical protein
MMGVWEERSFDSNLFGHGLVLNFGCPWIYDGLKVNVVWLFLCIKY